MNTQHKYRPKNISEFVFANDQVERQVKRYVTGKTVRPLVLYGPNGTGKSTLAELIPKALEGDQVTVNKVKAEDLNSNAEVRKIFTRSKQFDKMFAPEGQSRNYTVIEEVNFDPKAKGAMRESLDEMEGRDLIIFTTNELDKLDPGLLSRAEVVEVPPASAERFLPRAQEILKSEGVELSDSDVLEVLDSVYEVNADNRSYYKALDEIIEAWNDETNFLGSGSSS
jgi:replication-associated recombination protein RarA